MFRNVLPSILLAPALMLAGCGQSREAELEQQLAAAKAEAQAANESAARANSAEKKARASADLAKFYGGEEITPDDPQEKQKADDTPVDNAAAPVPAAAGTAPAAGSPVVPLTPIQEGPFRVGQPPAPVG
ncbi:hypothetical protein WBP06_09185 [Novosphingobium sp. BL-8H]|uniref:hypothetical protein n=1 Tax=Novosphingobium sp. BL-8H TaxID=3127640 RepID=UPI003756B88C